MRLPDFWTGAAFAALGLIIAVLATSLHVPAGAASPRLFPLLIGGLMGLMGMAIAIRGMSQGFRIELPTWLGSRRQLMLVAYLPVAIAAFALLAPDYGTIAIALPIVVVHCLIYGLALLPALGMGVVAGGLIPLAFTRLLGIPLPHGIIEGLL